MIIGRTFQPDLRSYPRRVVGVRLEGDSGLWFARLACGHEVCTLERDEERALRKSQRGCITCRNEARDRFARRNAP